MTIEVPNSTAGNEKHIERKRSIASLCRLIEDAAQATQSPMLGTINRGTYYPTRLHQQLGNLGIVLKHGYPLKLEEQKRLLYKMVDMWPPKISKGKRIKEIDEARNKWKEEIDRLLPTDLLLN